MCMLEHFLLSIWISWRVPHHCYARMVMSCFLNTKGATGCGFRSREDFMVYLCCGSSSSPGVSFGGDPLACVLVGCCSHHPQGYFWDALPWPRKSLWRDIIQTAVITFSSVFSNHIHCVVNPLLERLVLMLMLMFMYVIYVLSVFP